MKVPKINMQMDIGEVVEWQDHFNNNEIILAKVNWKGMVMGGFQLGLELSD